MTPHDLLANFETLAEAPNGVQRLRELVLELAVRGKLVEQDSEDEPAKAILIRIQSERIRQVTTKKKPSTPSMPVSQAEYPFDIPDSWVWARASQLGIVNPRNEGADGAMVAFVPMAVLSTDYRAQIRPEVRPWNEIKKGYTHLADGDIAIAKITPCFENGKAAVFENLPGGYGAGTTELHVLRPIPGTIDPHFFLLFFKSPTFVSGGVATMTGTAGQQRVSGDYFTSRPIPVPPNSEQRRIVARVDELMGLLDRMEAKHQEREAARTAARDSALACLRDAPNSDDVEVAWLRIQERLLELFSTPEDIQWVRQTILQLAIRGRLLRQRENTHWPSRQLGQIQGEKQKPIRAKKVRAAKPLLPVPVHERTFQAPPGWEWTPFGDLFLEVITGPFGSSLHASDYVAGGIPIVNPQNLQAGMIVPTPSTAVSPETAERLGTFRIKAGDILVARRGEMGRCAVAGPAETGWLCGTGSLILRPKSNLSPEFIALFLRCPETTSRLVGESVGTTMSNLNQRILVNLPIALPPYEEQIAIVGAVHDFDRRCKNLEAALRHSNELAATFSAAAVHHLDA